MPKPTFGCPFHGLVKGGSLTLPDASTMDYPQPASSELGAGGITHRVKGAAAAIPDRTPEQAAADTVKNHQWLDYAIVSGENGQLCGQELGDYWHLYTDPAGVTWKMTARLYVAGLQVRIRINLINAYGRMPKRWEDVSREILSVDYVLPNGETDQTEYVTAPDYLRAPERNSNGSVLLFHLYWGEVLTDMYYFPEKGFPSSQELRAAYKVTLSGTGNFANSQLPLGQGISAAAMLYKDLDDIVEDRSVNNSYQVTWPIWSCHPTDCGHTNDHTFWDNKVASKEIVRLVFDSADQEVELAYQAEEHYEVLEFDVTVVDCASNDCVKEWIYNTRRTISMKLLRDDIVVAASGDVVTLVNTYRYMDNLTGGGGGGGDLTETIHTTVNWRGVTLRDSDLFNLDGEAVAGDHADGVNLKFGIAFISPQIIGLAIKQGERIGPTAVTLKRVHIGPAIAAEADSSGIDVLAPTNWALKIFGSYEPSKKEIARATDGKVCYV